MDGPFEVEATGESTYVMLDKGFAAPFSFEVTARWEDGDSVRVVAGVSTDTGARARSVTVETANPRGVTNAVMQHVPVRELVWEGVRQLLRKVEATGGPPTFVAVTEQDAAVAAAKLVKWVKS